jgi:hypothetical protein
VRLLNAGLAALCAAAVPEFGAGQSTLLTALDGSAPAPVLEPIAVALVRGLAGVWIDPTVDPRATGVFFGMQHASYASLQVFHAVVAFRWGPRWSFAYGSVELADLFDSSLTNQDPGLSSLRARAAWGRLDAAVGSPRLAASAGLGLAADDNVGVLQSSTVVRAHLRMFPFKRDNIRIGVQGSWPVGGSVPAVEGGREAIDLTVRQALGRSWLSVTAAASRGALWRYSETRSGYAVAAQLNILSQLALGVAVGRYGTTYGISPIEWSRSVSAALRIGSLRLGTRYASTRLGVGSGLALSLGYEPGFAQGGPP